MKAARPLPRRRCEYGGAPSGAPFHFSAQKAKTITDEKTIIEVNGIKLEVDMRYARRIETMRVGSRVKLLTKNYSSGHDIESGVVIGFEPFKTLPTIVVAYIKSDYNGSDVKFAYINSKSTEVDLVLATDDDFAFDRAKVIKGFDRMISTKQREIDVIEEKKAYFLQHFGAVWSAIMREEEEPLAPPASPADPF